MTYYDLTPADRWFAVYEDDSIPVAVWAMCQFQGVLGLVPQAESDVLIPAMDRKPGFKYYGRMEFAREQAPNE